MKQIQRYFYIATILFATVLVSCKDDANTPAPPASVSTYKSLIQGFADPNHLFYDRTDFKFDYLFDKNDKITGVLVKSFKIRPIGEIFQYQTNAEHFNALLKEYGDTVAPIILPEEAWDYLPSTKAISKFGIAPTTDQLPDLKKGQDCSRYFDISFISYYDFIKNGYSWAGIENPGPEYRMSLEEFNNLDIEKKRLIDINKITLHLSPEVANNYTDPIELSDNLQYSMLVILEDGGVLMESFTLVDHYLGYQLWNYIQFYNNPLPNL